MSYDFEETRTIMNRKNNFFLLNNFKLLKNINCLRYWEKDHFQRSSKLNP